MNVFHINKSDIGGGAAIAAYRLHSGLLAAGIDSGILVDVKKTSSEKISSIPRKRLVDEISLRLTQPMGLNYLNILGTKGLRRQPDFQQADIINFHNLHGGYFNYLAISTLSQLKPTVWTLHDMWSFTGHCAYSFDCNKWQSGCGNCPYPETYPNIKSDSTRLEWKIKDWIYRHSPLSIVAPSRWLVEQAEKSMLSRFPIFHIPYGIDIDVFQPIDTSFARQALNIPQDRQVLLIGADSRADPRKGIDLLMDALQHLPERITQNLFLLSFGNGSDHGQLGFPTLDLGHITNDRVKALIYSAADLFILPTRADNLPLVLQESLACGTPMVSFDTGGVSDLVRPGTTGYLAEAESIQDLRNGIISLLEDKEMLHRMSKNCRAIGVEEYPLQLQSKRYLELYTKLITSEKL